MPLAGHPDTADAVVVGGGTVGALVRLLPPPGRPAGHPAGEGPARPGGEQPGRGRGPRPGRYARGRATGPVVPALLPGQRDDLGIDSGFVAQGYLLPCFTETEVTAARERMAMQLDLGLDVEWLAPAR